MLAFIQMLNKCFLDHTNVSRFTLLETVQAVAVAGGILTTIALYLLNVRMVTAFESRFRTLMSFSVGIMKLNVSSSWAPCRKISLTTY